MGTPERGMMWREPDPGGVPTRTGDAAQAIGKGLVAGAVGTVAITASRMLAQKLLHEEMPTAAAEAAEKLVGVEPKDEKGKLRLGMLTHFAYGSAMGIPRALLQRSGVRGWKADAVHLVAVQSAASGWCSPRWRSARRPPGSRPSRLGSTRCTTLSTPWPPERRSVSSTGEASSGAWPTRPEDAS